MSNLQSGRQSQFEEYLRDGITAARNGQRKLAETLLNRALLLNNTDARPYLWLSTTTDDPAEQLDLLEKAVSLDPTNASARRGLALLKGKIAPQQLGRRGPAVVGEVESTGQSFLCPKCGGRMSFDLQSERLTCEYCGYVEAAKDDRRQVEETEQVLDFVMPTQAAHGWAAAGQQFKCEKCGALTLLPAGQSAVQCPYCGSNQIVRSPGLTDLIDPHAILPMRINEQEANKLTRNWLGSGLFAPDALAASGTTTRLRPGYYSCWTFDGTVEVRWSCEVSDGSGRNKRWIATHGAETRFFNDILASGVSAFPERDLDRVGPFEAALGEIFKPEYLAGWPAILYDKSLSDCSLVARDKVLRWLRPQLWDLVEPGREKRNLNIGSGNFSGMTFKHLLVPVWLGEYRHDGQEFRVMVNGVNGRVAGDKPRDTVKVWMSVLMGLLLLGLLIFVLWLLADMGII